MSDIPLPKEVPFESILALQNRWNERHNEIAAQIDEAKCLTAGYEAEMNRMKNLRDREFERLLGTETVSAIERDQDTRYQEMKRHADTWGLDDSSTNQVYRTIKYYEKAAADYQTQAKSIIAQGQKVDWSEVDGNLKLFTQQTEQTLRSYLGDARYEKLQRNQLFPFASAK